jgi:hypothetical protein
MNIYKNIEIKHFHYAHLLVIFHKKNYMYDFSKIN